MSSIFCVKISVNISPIYSQNQNTYIPIITDIFIFVYNGLQKLLECESCRRPFQNFEYLFAPTILC